MCDVKPCVCGRLWCVMSNLVFAVGCGGRLWCVMSNLVFAVGCGV